MTNNYCLPIIKKVRQEVVSKIENNLDDYGFFEIWLDYIEDINPEFISDLINKYDQKLVFLFRRLRLEKPVMNIDDQADYLRLLDGKKCIVDLDIYNQTALIEQSRGGDLNRIISYHNYNETPDDDKLNEIIKEINHYNPEILKISTFCNDNSDALRLLKIMLEIQNNNQKHIILGMGEKGVITRLYGTLWGNELTFIPDVEDAKSAPGQITKDEFEKSIKDFN